MLNFVPNMLIPVLTGEKTVQILEEKYSRHIFVENGISIGKKPVAGVSETSNSAHRQITSCQEKTSKLCFSLGPASLWKRNLKYTIFFRDFVHSVNYLMLFWGQCSIRPHNVIHILPADCLNCIWLWVNLAAAEDCVQLIPKYYSKVKLRNWQSPNISVWNN